MKTIRKTLFISDLHLEESRPAITHAFITLLNNCDASIDALYILGDLFEAWIGDDENTPYQQKIIQALRATTDRGIPIYFMYGNRDFLIGKKFLRASGCKLLSDEEKISVYGTPVLLMHGDTLCTQDVAYLKARKNGRNVFYQFLFLLLPLALRKNIANKMRAKSARHTQSTAREIMDVTQTEVERVMQKHHVNYLIHGHTHKTNTHHFTIDSSACQRIVLADWHDKGSALAWNENGKQEWLII